MTGESRGRLERQVAERLRTGGFGYLRPEEERALIRLLADAARPEPVSVVREEAAAMAFLAAGHRGRRRWYRPKNSIKAALGVVVAGLTLGGVAVAATGGIIPSPFAGSHAGTRPAATGGPGDGKGIPVKESSHPGGKRDPGEGRGDQEDQEALVTLCRIYVTEGERGTRPSSLERLVEAAGSLAGVKDLCAERLGEGDGDAGGRQGNEDRGKDRGKDKGKGKGGRNSGAEGGSQGGGSGDDGGGGTGGSGGSGGGGGTDAETGSAEGNGNNGQGNGNNGQGNGNNGQGNGGGRGPGNSDFGHSRGNGLSHGLGGAVAVGGTEGDVPPGWGAR